MSAADFREKKEQLRAEGKLLSASALAPIDDDRAEKNDTEGQVYLSGPLTASGAAVQQLTAARRMAPITVDALKAAGFNRVSQRVGLSPHDHGVPHLRPRYYCLASRVDEDAAQRRFGLVATENGQRGIATPIARALIAAKANVDSKIKEQVPFCQYLIITVILINII